MSSAYSTAQIAALVSVHPNTVRFYEQIGFITPPRRRVNGYRVYDAADLERLNIIRTLRCANYSLAAILRLLRRLDSGRALNVERVLNTPAADEDVVSVCDRLLLSLDRAAADAEQIQRMLAQMAEKFSTLQ